MERSMRQICGADGRKTPGMGSQAHWPANIIHDDDKIYRNYGHQNWQWTTIEQTASYGPGGLFNGTGNQTFVAYQAAARIEEHEATKKPVQKNDLGEQKRVRKVRYENGLPIKVLGVIQDITEQKKAEKERKQLEDQLQHAQKMEAIGTLAGGVAHDLNNILSGLVSYPELLLLQLPEDSPLRKSILTIQKSGEKAAAVVQDLLTLARRGVVVNYVIIPNDVISEYL